jgi:hypothetical protein
MVLMAEEPILTMKLVPPEIVNPACEEHPLPADLAEKPGRDILKSHMEDGRQIISAASECSASVTHAAERQGWPEGPQLKMIGTTCGSRK